MKYFEHLALLKSIKGMGLVKINKTYCDFIKAHPDFNEFKECIVDDGIATSFDIAEAVARISKTINTVEQNSQLSIITCFDDEYPQEFTKQIFFAGMNCPTEGGGVKMAPDASTFDGKLTACMAHGIPKIMTFFKLPLLSAGKHQKLKGFLARPFSKVKIISDQIMTVHADGEYAGDSTEVELYIK